jgi:hypothetical protein
MISVQERPDPGEQPCLHIPTVDESLPRAVFGAIAAENLGYAMVELELPSKHWLMLIFVQSRPG